MHASVAHQIRNARNQLAAAKFSVRASEDWASREHFERKVAYWQAHLSNLLETLESEPVDPYAEGGSRDEPGWSESQPCIQ